MLGCISIERRESVCSDVCMSVRHSQGARTYTGWWQLWYGAGVQCQVRLTLLKDATLQGELRLDAQADTQMSSRAGVECT